MEAFSEVEAELSEVKAVVRGVHGAGAPIADRASSTANLTNATRTEVQLQQNSLRAAAVEAEQVGIKSGLVDSHHASTLLTAQMHSVVRNIDAAVAAAVQL